MRLLPATGLWCLFLLSMAIIPGALSGDSGQDAEPEHIATLIRQLGHNKFARREAANRELQAAAEKALPALQTAASTSADVEIRQRAQQLVRAILLGLRKSQSTGLELVLIEAGEYRMGSPPGEANREADEIQHPVRITTPFLLGKYEVTQGEYRQVMQINPSWFVSTGPGKHAVPGLETTRFPVERVTWYDAIEFCNRLSKLDGYQPYYHLSNIEQSVGSMTSATVRRTGGNGYRLPTEAEWEYACRAGTSGAYHFVVRNPGRDGNFKPSPFSGGYGGPPSWRALERTERVGSYPPNHWGLYDMHGNVSEWCWDWYSKDYYGVSPGQDPQGPVTGKHHVLRGGSWLVSEGSCRSASRFWHIPGEGQYHAGFRVARSPLFQPAPQAVK